MKHYRMSSKLLAGAVLSCFVTSAVGFAKGGQQTSSDVGNNRVNQKYVQDNDSENGVLVNYLCYLATGTLIVATIYYLKTIGLPYFQKMWYKHHVGEKTAGEFSTLLRDLSVLLQDFNDKFYNFKLNYAPYFKKFAHYKKEYEKYLKLIKQKNRAVDIIENSYISLKMFPELHPDFEGWFENFKKAPPESKPTRFTISEKKGVYVEGDSLRAAIARYRGKDSESKRETYNKFLTFIIAEEETISSCDKEIKDIPIEVKHYRQFVEDCRTSGSRNADKFLKSFITKQKELCKKLLDKTEEVKKFQKSKAIEVSDLSKFGKVLPENIHEISGIVEYSDVLVKKSDLKAYFHLENSINDIPAFEKLAID